MGLVQLYRDYLRRRIAKPNAVKPNKVAHVGSGTTVKVTAPTSVISPLRLDVNSIVCSEYTPGLK